MHLLFVHNENINWHDELSAAYIIHLLLAADISTMGFSSIVCANCNLTLENVLCVCVCAVCTLRVCAETHIAHGSLLLDAA